MRADHDDHAENIALIRRLTCDLTPPEHACGSWRSLYGGLSALFDDLAAHIALAPCLGWDEGCYRLGWGGGYFDRTLAALSPRPVTIGVALASARLTTIYPQPHDVPLDMIVTETGVSGERKDPS